MNPNCRRLATAATFLVALLASGSKSLRADTTGLTIDQQETFLRTAKIVSSKGNKEGVTQTVRVTLTDGTTTHDASVQRIYEHKPVYQLESGIYLTGAVNKA